MLKTKYIVSGIVLLISVFMVLPNISMAQEEAQKDLTTYTCKDIMRFSGGERNIAIAFLHGYLLGEKKMTSFNTDELGEASDRFTEYCLDTPNEKALKAMRKFTK